MRVRSIRNAIIGGKESDQHDHTNKYTRGVTQAMVELHDKLYGTRKKRFMIPLALPVALAMGLTAGAIYPAMIVDRIANLIRDKRDGKSMKGQAIALPIKVLIITAVIPLGLALIPVFTIALTIVNLVHLRKL
jgi:hypothetical protein